MRFNIVLPAVACLALTAAAALAADTPAPAPAERPHPMMRGWDKADMAQHLARMCSDHYARTVGKLAYLETKLGLAAKQKPLFDRWKDDVLASAKARSDACNAFKLPETRPTLVDRLKMDQKLLLAGADAIKAQMPALEAFNASLSEEQQRVLDRTVTAMLHEGMERMHGWRDRMRDGDRDGQRFERRIIMRHNGDGPDSADLPPPPAQ